MLGFYDTRFQELKDVPEGSKLIIKDVLNGFETPFNSSCTEGNLVEVNSILIAQMKDIDFQSICDGHDISSNNDLEQKKLCRGYLLIKVCMIMFP
jgi:hypothetical protein